MDLVEKMLQAGAYPHSEGVGHPGPIIVEQVRWLTRDDLESFWVLDNHYPRGMSPLGVDLVNITGMMTQAIAERIPLPPGRGLHAVFGGSHVYAAEIPVTSEWEMGFRGYRAAQNIPRMIAGFADAWKEAVEELETGFAHFRDTDPTSLAPHELGQHLEDAITFHLRAWEIHFEMMYPLLANYVGFYGLCAEFGIPPSEISKFLQGYDTKILETDRELWKLARAADELGLRDTFVGRPVSELRAALEAGASGRAFLEQLDAFLDRFGWRTEGIIEPTFVPWIEDPTPALATVRGFLSGAGSFDFESAHAAAVEERDRAVAAAKERLTVEEQEAFDTALAGCRAANFAWWNEEHNFYIDMRSHIPVRRAAMAIARAAGAADPEDAMFLYAEELLDVAAGRRTWAEFADAVADRRAYFREWWDLRADMPKVLGPPPPEVTDPVLKEILGVNEDFLRSLGAVDPDAVELKGTPVSSGVARGRARVLRSADEIGRIEPGDILVCEATTPSWTPAFGIIAGCVCDTGGTLSHASIVSREYRVPCVVGVGVGSKVITDGDIIEVDGGEGLVRIVERG